MELICQTILRIVEQLPPEDVLVVKRRLLKLGLSGVSVSTIHRAQGSERHTVLFDPVKGASKWLCSDDGRRLINVAISRAKARLIIPLSRGDRKNVYLYFIAEMAKEDPAPACRTGLDLDEEETRQPKELSSEATPHESMTTSIQSRHENRASNNRTTVKPSPAAAFILRGIRGLLDTQQGTPIGKPRMITSTDPGFVNLYIEYLGQFRTQEPTFDNALEELDKLGLVWVRSEVHEDVKRPRFSWTRIKGESNVQGGGGNGSIEGRGTGRGIGADGGSPKGDWSPCRRGGGRGGLLGAGAAVERQPEARRGAAAAAWRIAGGAVP